MATVGLNLNFSGYTGKLIVVWAKNSSPLTEVGRSTAFDFPVVQVLTVENLDPVVYNFRFWQSSDGTTLSTEIMPSWQIDASKSDGKTVERFQYVVDRGSSGTGWADPSDLDTVLNDTRLSGATKADLFIVIGVQPQLDAEYNLVTGGGIELLGGAAFSHDDRIFIEKTTPVQNQLPPSTSGEYEGTLIVTGNFLFGSTHHKKKIPIVATAPIITGTFPNFSLIPDTRVRFSTYSGDQRYLVLQFDSGNTVRLRGEDLNRIVLGKGEMIEIEFISNVAYVIDASISDRVGERYFVDKIGANMYLRDGIERQIADDPRIVDFILSLPAGQVESDLTTWQASQDVVYVLDQDGTQRTKTIFPNKHKFFYNAGSGKWRTPDDRDLFIRALKTNDAVADTANVNSLNVPGAYFVDSMMKHTTPFVVGNAGTAGADVYGRGGSIATGHTKWVQGSRDEVSPSGVRCFAVIGV
jgi:hypothetical protein